MSYYPSIDAQTIKSLTVLKKFLKEDPNYLNSVNCPYSSEVMRFVESLVVTPAPASASPYSRSYGGTPAPAPPPPITPPTESIDVEAEILKTFKELNNHKPDINDSAAMQGHYRTRTALLTKLSELHDKSKNQKQIGEFYQTVLNILDTICSASQREQFKELLSEFAK